jgi:hypothetical protein
MPFMGESQHFPEKFIKKCRKNFHFAAFLIDGEMEQR